MSLNLLRAATTATAAARGAALPTYYSDSYSHCSSSCCPCFECDSLLPHTYYFLNRGADPGSRLLLLLLLRLRPLLLQLRQWQRRTMYNLRLCRVYDCNYSSMAPAAATTTTATTTATTTVTATATTTTTTPSASTPGICPSPKLSPVSERPGLGMLLVEVLLRLALGMSGGSLRLLRRNLPSAKGGKAFSD